MCHSEFLEPLLALEEGIPLTDTPSGVLCGSVDWPVLLFYAHREGRPGTCILLVLSQ